VCVCVWCVSVCVVCVCVRIISGFILPGETEVLGETPVQIPFCPPQIPN